MAGYTGQGRGLTAPSRAASYHGPMPTLSTCPSWNKDGRGLQEHPRGVILMGSQPRGCIRVAAGPRVENGCGRRGGFFARCNRDKLDEM